MIPFGRTHAHNSTVERLLKVILWEDVLWNEEARTVSSGVTVNVKRRNKESFLGMGARSIYTFSTGTAGSHHGMGTH